MRTCGIHIDIDKVRFIILSCENGICTVVNTENKFLTLADRDTANGVKEFKDILHSFFDHHNLDNIGIISRIPSGRMSSHGLSYKIEGLIQLYESCPVEVISLKTVIAYVDKNPHSLECEKKNQESALQLAYYLSKNYQ